MSFFNSPFKFLAASSAVFVFTFCLSADVNAQGGFRIGNVIQAGGGQGFRIGGPNVGMHFGGGQGTTIGTQNFGMRFGNGQGARFGGANFGMQFGGQQGTQIGQFATQPSVSPGTYYYGARQDAARPIVQQPIPQSNQPLVQPRANAFGSGQQTTIPSMRGQNSGFVQPLEKLETTRGNAPAEGGLILAAPSSIGNGTQTDIASPANVPTASVAAPVPTASVAAPIPEATVSAQDGKSVLNKPQDSKTAIDKN